MELFDAEKMIFIRKPERKKLNYVKKYFLLKNKLSDFLLENQKGQKSRTFPPCENMIFY